MSADSNCCNFSRCACGLCLWWPVPVACAYGGLCLWWPVLSWIVDMKTVTANATVCQKNDRQPSALDHHDHPFNLVVIVMLVEVGPLMLNMIIQRLNLIQLWKFLRKPILITEKWRQKKFPRFTRNRSALIASMHCLQQCGYCLWPPLIKNHSYTYASLIPRLLPPPVFECLHYVGGRPGKSGQVWWC